MFLCRRREPAALRQIYKHRLMRHWKRSLHVVFWSFWLCPLMMNTEQEEKRVFKVFATFYGLLEVVEQLQLLGGSHVKIL